jgi:hypothetical protein
LAVIRGIGDKLRSEAESASLLCTIAWSILFASTRGVLRADTGSDEFAEEDDAVLSGRPVFDPFKSLICGVGRRIMVDMERRDEIWRLLREESEMRRNNTRYVQAFMGAVSVLISVLIAVKWNATGKLDPAMLACLGAFVPGELRWASVLG